jgi:hypothetical protein
MNMKTSKKKNFSMSLDILNNRLLLDFSLNSIISEREKL